MSYGDASDRRRGAMDDDKEKSIVEKTVQTVKDIASTVSDAAKHAMEPEPLKPGEEAVTYARMAGDGVISDPMMPPFVVIPPRKKSTSKKAPKTTAKKRPRRPLKNQGRNLQKSVCEESGHKNNEEGCDKISSQEI